MFGKVRKVLRFLKNYKLYSYGYLLAIIFNIGFEIVSIATIIPFLQIIFKDSLYDLNAQEPNLDASLSSLIDYGQYLMRF